MSAGIPQDIRETGGLGELEESESLQKGEEYCPAHGEVDEDSEYVIEKMVGHGYRDDKLILKVKRYGYTIKDARWEQIEHLRRSLVMTYFRQKKLPLLPQVVRAQLG